MLFKDREEAGCRLGELVAQRIGGGNVLVLGLPRGGVPVAAGVAAALRAPLDVLVVRKLGAPGCPELAIGAVARGVTFIENDLIRQLSVSPDYLRTVIRREHRELRRIEERLRQTAPPVDARGKTILLVDDGIATGSTIQAAVACARLMGSRRTVVAAPVAAAPAARRLRRAVDEVVALDEPEHLGAVGFWYDDFRQTPDEEVMRLLAGAASWPAG